MAYFNFSEIDNTNAEPELKICSGNLSDYDWSDFTPRRFLEEVQKRSDEAEICAGKKMPGTLDELLAVCREKGNERMTAMMNFSEQAQSAMLPDGTSLELSAYEMRILGMCKQ